MTRNGFEPALLIKSYKHYSISLHLELICWHFAETVKFNILEEIIHSTFCHHILLPYTFYIIGKMNP